MVNDIGSITGRDDRYLKMWEVSVEPEMKMLRDHRHINFEFTAVLDGHGVYHTVAGDEIMENGDVFVFSSNEPHCITNIESEGLKLLNLHFNDFFIEGNPLLSLKYPNIFFNHSRNFKPKISKDKSEKVFEYLFAIKEELKNEKEGKLYAITSYIGIMFIELIRNHSYYLPQSSVFTKILKSIEYIDENFDRDITLEEISAESNITPNYFSKLFKDAFNIKLWDYITAKRIEKSKKLIIFSDDDKILDIALSCGFNNTANFNRAFKLHTGMTPREYKRSRGTRIS